MDKEKREALQWFVDFANMDLETIKPGDKAKLLIESEEYLWPEKVTLDFSKGQWEAKAQGFPVTNYPKVSKLEQPAIIETITAKEHYAMVASSLKERPSKESPEYWDIVLNLQRIVQSVLIDVEHHVLIESGPRWYGAMLVKLIQSPGKKPFRLAYMPVNKDYTDYVRVKLYSLLDGFPSHAIQRCPGCKRFFLNPTLREKTFCSPRCMWRVNTRKRRDADREGYRKYQRELMRDRYRENHGHRRLKTKPRKAKKGE